MPNRTEARSAKAALTNATGRLPLLRLFSTLLILPAVHYRSARHRPPEDSDPTLSCRDTLPAPTRGSEPYIIPTSPRSFPAPLLITKLQ